MRISIISDIHVHPDKNDGLQILRKFCNHQKVLTSDLIIFLGDIFDLMVYSFADYEDLYKASLDEIEKLLNLNKKIIFVEGNHDFCIEKIMKNKFPYQNFSYFKNGFILNSNGKKFAFYHGDTIEIENVGYRIYRYFIKSAFLQYFYQKILGFQKVWSIGSYFLKQSHDRHEKYLSSDILEKIKNKFRLSAINFFKRNEIDYLICGHSHIKDDFIYSKGRYLNNGFASIENTFLLYDNSDFEFIDFQDF